MTKYIFVTGGVISGLGKGVTSASIGSILQMLGGNRVTIKKLDPYLNIDPGTMNPIEHGEVFVTEDGAETDLDLGYYERFLEMEMSKKNSTSSGKLFQELFNRERDGQFLGKTVQVIPHFTNIIKEFICEGSSEYDYIICEIGGSIGDIEAMAFYESLRQLRIDLKDDILFIHLTYLMYYSITGELKTKPTQNSIRDLQQVGITPDILICRTEHSIPEHIIDKLSLHTNLHPSHIIEAKNSTCIYDVPLLLIKEGLHTIISKHFKITTQINTNKWKLLNNSITKLKKEIKIGILGKYTELNDSYKSLLEAIFHAGIKNKYKIKIQWINARFSIGTLETIDGLIIPGGFGTNGIENMISLINQARVQEIPTLGICLGMQLMVIEYCRNVLNIKDATSTEIDGINGTNVVTLIKEEKKMGGSMRLGCKDIFLEGSKLSSIYKKKNITERHRHRYIINNEYIQSLNKHGCLISGFATIKTEEKGNSRIIEAIEDEKHPWYIGCQYHPEYKSSPFNPHPLFVSFIKKCVENNSM